MAAVEPVVVEGGYCCRRLLSDRLVRITVLIDVDSDALLLRKGIASVTGQVKISLQAIKMM